MSKHVLDRPRAPATSRASRYLEADRQQGLHPATRQLVRRQRGEAEGQASGLRNFIRIERDGEGRT